MKKHLHFFKKKKIPYFSKDSSLFRSKHGSQRQEQINRGLEGRGGCLALPAQPSSPCQRLPPGLLVGSGCCDPHLPASPLFQ